MSNKVAEKRAEMIGLQGIDAKRDIKRIAKAVTKRRIVTAEQLTTECLDLAYEHNMTIVEVYQRVWAKVSVSTDLHPTHPSGKTEAYHTLRDRAQRNN
jgi:hypothetical protein